jgi:hypothetical protein
VNRREEIEMLAALSEQPPGSNAPPVAGLTQSERVQGLLDLAEQLQAILVPVQPNPDYRRRLHGDLILEAQQGREDSQMNLLYQHRKGIIIGAAAVGSVASVVGVAVAFVLRNRQGRATNIA